MSKAVAAYGVRFTAPDGWSVQFFAPQGDPAAGEYRGLNIHGASMSVPMDDDSTYGSTMMGGLGPLDIAFTINESLPHDGSGVVPGKGVWAGGRPDALTLDAFSPTRLQVTRAGQMGFQQACTLNGRPMDFYVVLGSAAAAARGLDGVNQMLSTLEVASSAGTDDFRPA